MHKSLIMQFQVSTKTVKELEDELATLNGGDSTIVDKKIKDTTTGMTLAFRVSEEGSIITSV